MRRAPTVGMMKTLSFLLPILICACTNSSDETAKRDPLEVSAEATAGCSCADNDKHINADLTLTVDDLGVETSLTFDAALHFDGVEWQLQDIGLPLDTLVNAATALMPATDVTCELRCDAMAEATCGADTSCAAGVEASCMADCAGAIAADGAISAGVTLASLGIGAETSVDVAGSVLVFP